MTPTSKPLATPVASIAIDLAGRTITLTSLLGDALSLPVERSGVEITIVSADERPKVSTAGRPVLSVPVRDLSYYNQFIPAKSRRAPAKDSSTQA